MVFCVRPKLRPSIIYCIYYIYRSLVKLGGSRKASMQLPLPTLQTWIRSPSQTVLLITGARHRTCSSLTSGLQFPASPRNYSNKPTTSSLGNRGHPILWLLQSPFNGGALFPLRVLCGPVQCVASPPPGLWVCVTNNLLCLICAV